MISLCDLRNSERSILHNSTLCKSLTLTGMEKPESFRRARRRAKLALLLDEFGGPAQVARETETPKSHFSAMTAGKRGLGDELAAKLEAAYNKPPGWFDADEIGALVVQETGEGINVPVLANGGSMGPGSELLDEDVIKGNLVLSPSWIGLHIKPSRPDALRFIHGYGDSMAPTFKSGDILLVDTGIQDPRIDGIYVLHAHDRLFIKRVRQRLDGSIEVSSDNPTHKTVDVLNGDSQVEVKGRVVWVWNGIKL